MSFFQFRHAYPGRRSGEHSVERVIGWANPVLIDNLKYKGTTLFVDGTFRCVPRSFFQCVILMVHDQASNLFLPVFYVLRASKSTDVYWNVIHHVIQASDQKLDPATVVCDFESGLINAVLTQFPDANVCGYYFHFKQALRRFMKKLCIPSPEVQIAMTKVDILAVIDQEKIAVEGTAYVRKLIREKCVSKGIPYSHAKWDGLWAYFQRQWPRKYTPDLWNGRSLDKATVARTNNPLERFNRELNRTFLSPHPSLQVFVGGIERLGRVHVQMLHDIPRNRAAPPHR